MHTGAEPRLQERYEQLVMSHLSPAHALAAGLRLSPSLDTPWALTQGAWRFFANPQVSLDQLVVPLIRAVRQAAAGAPTYLPVVLDFTHLHYTGHTRKRHRIPLAHRRDLGYELLTALALDPADGTPLAPLVLELAAADGLHSTRAPQTRERLSVLDGLSPVFAYVQGLKLPAQPVFIVDREADSVGHYRAWDAAGHGFVIRADAQRQVWGPDLRPRRLDQVAQELIDANGLAFQGPVRLQDRSAALWVGATHVVLHRPARQHRVTNGQAVHQNVPGEALALRLIVTEVRDPVSQAVLARWYLLSNLAESVPAVQIAWWYTWRWRIEDYHKLLKGAGQQVESWLQQTPAALARRLLVAAMAAVVVWQLARERTAAGQELRRVLVRLSGRQIKRGKGRRDFTLPALLAGLGVLMPMLVLLESHSLADLRTLVGQILPQEFPASPPPRESG